MEKVNNNSAYCTLDGGGERMHFISLELQAPIGVERFLMKFVTVLGSRHRNMSMNSQLCCGYKIPLRVKTFLFLAFNNSSTAVGVVHHIIYIPGNFLDCMNYVST